MEYYSFFSLFWSYSKLFLLAIITTTLTKTLIHYFTLKPQKQKLKLPPGPKPWPIIGNIPEMLSNKPVSKWIHKLMKDYDTQIACVQLGNVHVITVSSPTIACEFLKKQDDTFASRPITMASELISSGYLTAALGPMGEQWRKMKKMLIKDLLSPVMHRWFHDIRMEEADNLLRYVHGQCTTQNNNESGGLVNVRVAAQHFCGNIIRRMIFNNRYFGEGRKDGGPGSEEIEHVEALFTLLNYLYAFCVSDYMPFLRGLDLDGHEKIVKNALRIINKYHDPIIEARVKQWTHRTKTEADDLLDVLISLKDANNNPLLTIDEIKAQIIELMIEVVDNPSNAVEWALAEMLNQPKLLERATEELDKVVGQDRLVQESDIPKLNYIKACAREAFRLHPIAPFNVPHVCMSDTVISNYFIPKGSHVLLSRQELGRNPKAWEDEPHMFKPERHLKHDGSEVFLTEPNLRLISFSTGKRGCPGVVLGSSMTVMLFARLIHGFTWSAPLHQPRVNLVESKTSLLLAQPLVALAKPRLREDVYILD